MVTFYRFLTQSVAILLNKLVCLHLYLDNTDGLIPKGFAVTLKTLTVFKNLAYSLHCNTLVLGVCMCIWHAHVCGHALMYVSAPTRPIYNVVR